MAFEVDRARRLLDAGVPLARSLRGRERLAIAGYVGGGRAALDAVERSGYEVLGEPPEGVEGAARASGSSRPCGRHVDVAEAYRYCEEVTRARAGNFYHGIRLLPAPRRAALCAVYALARRVDDIADGSLEDDGEAAPARHRAGRPRSARRRRSTTTRC